MLHKTLMLTLLVAFACKNSKQASSEIVDYQQTIVEQLGSSYETVEQANLVLCYTVDKKNLTNWTTVLVIDSASGDVVHGPQKLNAKVSWHSDRKLLIQETPEVIENKQSSKSYSYVLNLDTKQRENTTP